MIRCSRLTWPAAGIAWVLFVGGLGLHAATDWHRHAEPGAGFFHLHFHVGDHGHHHPDHDDHDHEAPGDGSHKRSAVLTVAHALDDHVPATLSVTSPGFAPDRTPIDRVKLQQRTELTPSANPRAPPA